jgi:hypothetical protein
LLTVTWRTVILLLVIVLLAVALLVVVLVILATVRFLLDLLFHFVDYFVDESHLDSLV